MHLVPVCAIASIVTIMSTAILIHLERRRGFLCIDVNKIERPSVPCVGGFGIAAGFLSGVVLSYVLGVTPINEALAVGISIVSSLLIGVMDDLSDLKSREKILLGLLPALPIVVLGIYSPKPCLPFLGPARLTIIYPLMVLLAFTVYQNGANMVDTHNGTLALFALSTHIFALLLKLCTSFQLNSDLALVAIFIAVLASYLPFNIYPAKIFNGNAGSFVIGASLAVSAIILRLEVYYILASMPMFVNGFYYISSVRRFLQKEKVERPTYLDDKGCIHSSTGKRVPITLVRFTVTLSKASLSEKELVTILYTVFILTSLTSFILAMMLGCS
ncbi:MAG: hypothetical protein N3D82_05915 [Ignisphaera sp.]|nr:hypothetical protein [Ignisphaera sp.]MCX8168541.1 hypothetical protein [Ignisphaera sp.]MDW8085127.1 hypothetical protein [Ignisphaera sp.]